MTSAETIYPRFETAGRTAASTAVFAISILPLGESLNLLKTIGQTCQSGFSSCPHWVGHWAAHVNPDIAIITGSRDGKIILVLPLEIISKSGIKVAQFVGGSHANANFPALNAELSQIEAETLLVGLKTGLRAKPWSVDVIILERQLVMLGGLTNPLLAGGSSLSPNVSLHLDVNQSFDAVLETRSGKRKRKRYRSQQRKFETAGGFSILNPNTKTDVDKLLGNYFAMKEQQLSGKGVTNVFGNPREQLFFKALFSDSGALADHQFYLSSLTVGGKTRAIYGSSLHGKRQMVHFTTFADDELAIASPGDFLNYSLIEAACRTSIDTYDLGVGDEGYKRSWCDVETWHRDTVIALSLRGTLAKVRFSGARAVKRWIKSNEKLWAFAKRVRKLKAGKSSKAQPADQMEDGTEL